MHKHGCRCVLCIAAYRAGYTRRNNSNKEKRSLAHKLRYASDPDFRVLKKSRTIAAQQRLIQRLKYAAYDLLGGHCVVCNIADYRLLQIDHILGDGKGDRDRIKIFRKIISGVQRDRYQLLCPNCHFLKTNELLSVIQNSLRFPTAKVNKPIDCQNLITDGLSSITNSTL